MSQLPSDLFTRVSRQDARRVPHDLSSDDVKDSIVMWRASSRHARLDATGAQVKDEDGELVFDSFSPGDEVPDYVMEHMNFGSFVKTGRIYVRPWPRSRPIDGKKVWDYVSNKSVSEGAPERPAEVASDAETPADLRELRNLRSNASMRNLKDAFDRAGVKYSNAASKSDLHALRLEVLGEADGTIVSEEPAEDVVSEIVDESSAPVASEALEVTAEGDAEVSDG